uniref:Uncharacterized protein n=1 Tax=Wood duck megrivirus TaxID=2759414 RepID=A0A7D6WUL6_9PICO|nr:hypothetical protein [Wood duck megrivirus]
MCVRWIRLKHPHMLGGAEILQADVCVGLVDARRYIDDRPPGLVGYLHGCVAGNPHLCLVLVDRPAAGRVNTV